jgi:hypothetical protein
MTLLGRLPDTGRGKFSRLPLRHLRKVEYLLLSLIKYPDVGSSNDYFYRVAFLVIQKIVNLHRT